MGSISACLKFWAIFTLGVSGTGCPIQEQCNELRKTTCPIWRRKWQPTPVFLPGEFHGQRGLVGCSPWGHRESDTTEWLTHTHTCPIMYWSWWPHGKLYILKLNIFECTFVAISCRLNFKMKMHSSSPSDQISHSVVSDSLRPHEHWRIDAFELWCWRKLLRVSWTARRSNQSILNQGSNEHPLH